ncbi:nucleotide pyrophosphohydrolase [Pelomonas sp. V22]|nr:nucleotide pyrophosphohydrolase [Pelomonas sp. V22]
MDVEGLQRRLREFAAARQWQAYQTPKNLAMAMVVEAAELVEIFQWLTPEESAAIADDPARHQHLGEEIADVLLYLLQIADHSGVDIAAAVEDKLIKNALKYPGP